MDYIKDTPRYIRITDIEENGSLNNNTKSASGNISEWTKYKLKDNDLLFARSGATVGKTYLYNSKDGDCIYAGYLIKFSINPDIAFAKYIKYFTDSIYYKKWV